MAAAAYSQISFQIRCRVHHHHKPSLPFNPRLLRASLSSSLKPLTRELQQLSMQIDVSKSIKNTYVKFLDAFVDSLFEFVDQPLLPSQSNFAPVDELREAAGITCVPGEGEIPDDFPEGVYVRNGPNPLFGGLKMTKSVFGRSSHTWIEGEGMLHALYFHKDIIDDGGWTLVYKNRYVETDTFKLERQRNKPSFLPAIEGHSLSILSAYLLNLLRFGNANKQISNTNVFEHSGKFYSISENHMPQEINIFTLQTLGNWDVNGAWSRPFTSHPKKVPGTGELVTMGVDAAKPYVEVGVISSDGNNLIHKVDLKLDRSTLCHEIGVTQRYIVFLDHPLTIDINRLLSGGPLIKYEHEQYARIGVMPRYGDADSIRWFDVKPNCTFHIVNCFEDHEEVVVSGCKALESIIPGPELGLNKYEWFSKKLRHVDAVGDQSIENGTTSEERLIFSRCYEWRLNMESGEVEERYLTGTEFSMDFPMINGNFTGIKHKYGYTQLVDSSASSLSGMVKYGGLAKLFFEEVDNLGLSSRQTKTENTIKIEYHKFEENVFCSGSAFVPKVGGVEEDDGWIISFVHNEDTNTSHVYIIDTKKFTSGPVAKIRLPCRVPYGFHGAFMQMPLPKYKHHE